MAVVKHASTTGRRERARATRLRMLTSAQSLFVERGYAATTMEDIAAASGVAVQTVYYTFKTKASLLRAVGELAGTGRPDPTPGGQRDWLAEVLAEPDGDRALALAIEQGVDIYVRAARLWPALQAASVSDPDVEDYFQTVVTNRRAGMGQLVAHLQQIGYLRSDLTAQRGTDIVFALVSLETYLALTRDADWPIEDVKAWLWTTLRMQLSGASRPAPEAVKGMSFESLC